MVKKLLSKLKDLIKEKNANPLYLFQQQDNYKTGRVPFYQFRQVITRIHETITESDLANLYERYKVAQQNGGSQDVDYMSLISDLNNVVNQEQTVLKLFNRIIEQMKLGRGDFFKEMENFDVRNTGFIESMEFDTVLRTLGARVDRDDMQAIEYIYQDEDSNQIEYSAIIRRFRELLAQKDIRYHDISKNQGYKEDIRNYRCRDIFLKFHKLFTRQQIVNPYTYFTKHLYNIDEENCVSNYEFGTMVDQLVYDIDPQDYKILENDLKSDHSYKISLDKFVSLYNTVKASLDSSELAGDQVNGSAGLKENRIFYAIKEALDAKRTNLEKYFCEYNYQPMLKTIQKKDFIIAFQDLNIEDSEFSVEMVVDAIHVSGNHLNLAELEAFIEDLNHKQSFYLSHPDNFNLKKFFEGLVQYTHSQNSMDMTQTNLKITRHLLQANKGNAGLMELSEFINDLRYYEIHVKEYDLNMLKDKYDTLDSGQINILEFCLDFESTLSNLMPQAENLLYERNRELKTVVDEVRGYIIQKYGNLGQFVNVMASESKSFKVNLSHLILQLQEIDHTLSLAEIYEMIGNMDKYRNGYVLDFKLLDFFQDFQDVSVSEKVILSLIEVLQKKKLSLERYLEPSVNQVTGLVDMNNLLSKLEKDGINQRDFRMMLNELNCSEFSVEPGDLQLKMKGECLRKGLSKNLLVEKYIIGKSSSAMCQKLIQDLNSKLRQRGQTFQQMFEYPQNQIMPKQTFKQKFQELDLLGHYEYAELLAALIQPSDPYVVSLQRFYQMMNDFEQEADGGTISVDKVRSLKKELKNKFKDYGVSVGRLFKNIDQDSSNSISQREFSYFLSQLDPDLSRAEIKALFDLIDKDGSRSISKIELEIAFGISLRDEMSIKLREMQFAANIFSEISHKMDERLLTAKQLFENLKNRRKISKSVFQRGIVDLDLQTLKGDYSIRKQFEKSLQMPNEEQVIDFHLLLMCLQEYQDESKEVKGYPNSTQVILSRLLKYFDYDVSKVSKYVDINNDKSISRVDFKVICKNLVSSASDRDIEGTYLNISGSDHPKEMPVSIFEDKLRDFMEVQKMRESQGIRDLIYSKKDLFLNECQLSDQIRNGYISISQFRMILTSFGYSYRIQELDSFKQAHSEDIKNDRVYYQALLKNIDVYAQKMQLDGNGSANVSGSPAQQFKEISEKIKRRVQFQTSVLMEEFSVLDRSKDLFVTLNELLEACEVIAESEIPPQVIALIEKRLRCYKDRQINYSRLVSLIFHGHTNVSVQHRATVGAIQQEFIEQIQLEMKVKGINSMQVFKYYDTNGDGIISLEEFEEAARNRLLGNTPTEIAELFEVLQSRTPNNRLNLINFRDLIFGYEKQDVRPFIYQLRSLLEAKNKTAGQLFDMMDNQQDKRIDFQEFNNSLQSLEPDKNIFEVDLLFSHFDQNSSGYIDLREFISALDRESIIAEFHDAILNYSHRNRIEFIDIFEKFSQGATLDRQEFLRMGREIWMGQLNERKFHSLFDELDNNKNNVLELDEMNYIFNSDATAVPNKTLNRFRISVLEYVQQRQQPLLDFYRAHSSGSMGWRRQQLTACTQNLRVQMTERSDTELFSLLDNDHDGEISYREFSHSVLGRGVHVSGLVSTLRRVVKMDHLDIRKKVTESDTNRNNVIHFDEFLRFLTSLNLHLSYNDSNALFEKIDLNRNGQISMDEMMDIFEKPVNEISRNKDIMSQLRDDLLDMKMGYQREITKFSTKDGEISSSSFVEFLRKNGSHLNRFESEEAFQNLDYHHKGFISVDILEQFLGRLAKEQDTASRVQIDSFSEKRVQEALAALRIELQVREKEPALVFRQIDIDSEGLISETNFRNLMIQNQLLTDNPNRILLLCKHYKEYRNNMVNYRRMIADMDSLKHSKPPLANELARKILSSMDAGGLDYKEFFKKYDSNYQNRLQIADFTKMVRAEGLVQERSSTLQSTFNYLSRVGSLQKSQISFYDFLKLFDFEVQIEETIKEVQPHRGIIIKLRHALLQKQMTIKEVLQAENTKSVLFSQVQNIMAASAEDISDLRSFVKEVEIQESGGSLDLDLFSKIIENIEISGKRKKGLGIVESHIVQPNPDRETAKQIEERKNLKEIRDYLKQLESFMLEDEVSFIEFFETKDSEKDGTVTFKDFEFLVYEELGVDENPIIDRMKIYGTTKPGHVDYRKLKDLLDDKNSVNFKKESVEGNESTPNQPLKENGEETTLLTEEEMLTKIRDHFKNVKKISTKNIFAKFSVDKKIADKAKFTKTITSNLKELKKDQIESLFNSLVDQHGTDGKLDRRSFILALYQEDIDLQLNPVRNDVGFEEQLKDVFKAVDVQNKNGRIEKTELQMCLRRLGLNLNQTEQDTLFNTFKESDEGSLNFEEFKCLVQSKVALDLVKPAVIADKLSHQISSIDVTRTGFLRENQIQYLADSLGAKMSRAEVADLMDEIGSNNLGEVSQQDLYHRVMAAKDHEFQSTRGHRAVLKLRSACAPTLAEVFNSFVSVPQNYFLSFSEELFAKQKNLPSQGLKPQLSKSGIYYQGVLPPNQVTDPKKTHKYEKKTFIRRTATNGLSMEIDLTRARGIPIPDPTKVSREQEIVGRQVRVLIFDKSVKQFIGNSVNIAANWYPSYEDRWYFDLHKITGENKILLKKDDFTLAKDKNLLVIFEFVHFVKKSSSSKLMAMSSGYASILLCLLNTPKSHVLDVIGGNPRNNDLHIDEEDIRAGRQGLVPKILSLFEGKVQPSLEITVRKPAAATASMMELLPPYLLLPSPLLKLAVLFRQQLGQKVFQFKEQLLNLSSDLNVSTFLQVLSFQKESLILAEFYGQNVEPFLAKKELEVDFRALDLFLRRLRVMFSDPAYCVNPKYPSMEVLDRSKLVKDREVLLKKTLTLFWTQLLKDLKDKSKKEPTWSALLKTVKSNARTSAPQNDSQPRSFDISELIDDEFGMFE